MSGARRAMRLYERGSALLARYEAGGGPARLDKAIGVLLQARETALPADEVYFDVLARLGTAFMARYADRPPAGGGTGDIDEAIGCYTAVLAGDPGVALRYAALLWLGDAHCGRFEQGGRDARDAQAAVRAFRRCLELLLSPQMDGLLADPARARLPAAVEGLGAAAVRLLEAGGDPRDLHGALAAAGEALAEVPGPGPAAAHCAQVYAQVVRLVRARTDLDVDAAAARAALDRLAPRESRYETGVEAVERYRETGDLGALDVAVDALRETTAGMQDAGGADVGHLGALGYALWQRALSAPDSPDVDEGVAVARLAYRHADTESSRDACVQLLCELLVLRHRVSGHLSDLDEAIDLHMGTVGRFEDDPRAAPGFAAAATAMQRRAEAVGDHRAGSTAQVMRMLHHRGENAGMIKSFFNLPYGRLAEMADEGVLTDPAFLDEVDAVIRDSRTRLDAASREAASRDEASDGAASEGGRAAALHDLVDALHARARASGGGFADEYVARLRELAAGLPGLPGLHRAAHEAELGFALHERFLRTGGTGDLDEALSCLERATAVEPVPTLFRVVTAKARGHFAALAGRWDTADDAYGRALALLPRFAARHLSHDDHLRQLAPLAGLPADAAAAAIRNGAAPRALELLEQGRGLLIGYVLDAQHDLTRLAAAEPALARALRDAGDGLAEEADPHAPAPPGAAGAADRRIALARQWDAAVASIRRVPGFADFLVPPRLADLLPAADGGPVVTVNVSRFGCDALVLADGALTVVPLPGLSEAEVRERAAGFLAALPFAELAPDDEQATADAQEPLRRTLSWLRGAVVGPVLDHLRERPCGAARVWWVPTGLLAALPLHAAALDESVSSYAPTIRALRTARAARPAGAAGAAAGRVVALADAPGLPPLPGAAAEADRLARRLPGAGRLSGADATREGVLAAVRDAGWAHIACHASSYAAWPVRSALHLADGPLTAGEILRAGPPGRGRLAYLSACETVLAGSALADEVIHLGSALHTAGFRHVVGTLWRVTDGTAAETARLFYDALHPDRHPDPAVGLDADRAAEALHAAALELRARYPLLPARWAGYVHIGP